MSDELYCYWCKYAPVNLGEDCPGCGVRLGVILPPHLLGDGLLDRLWVKSYKDIVMTADQKVFADLDALEVFQAEEP